MKKIICILLAIMLAFSGCKKEKVLGFDILSGVKTFDPQLSSGDSELILVKNCFQGLLDKDENGALITGAAERYKVSDDGLIYTFYLQRGLLWSDGETPVTADDFVFAFQRLFKPETNAPFRSDFFNILNSEKILNGEKAMSTLGVRAVDNYTVEFTLTSADPLFPELLVTSAAMPCNRAFFESTIGRYGLGKEYIIFNGAYYLRRINNSSYVISPNPYSSIANLIYKNVYLFVKDDPRANAVARLTDKTVDAAVINRSDREALPEKDFVIKESENTLWALAFNTKNECLSNVNIRRAIAYAIDKSLFADSIDESFRTADAYIPESVTLNGKSYRKTAGESFSGFGFDPDMASSLFKTGLRELDISRLPTLTVICTQEFIPAMGYLQKSVQDNLAVFINLIPVTSDELSARLASGDYDMAVVSFTPQYDSPNALFSVFGDANNLTGFYDADISAAASAASHMKSYDDMAEGYALAEQMLLQAMPALPLFYETSYFAVSKSISGLDYSVFGGHIAFRFCE